MQFRSIKHRIALVGWLCLLAAAGATIAGGIVVSHRTTGFVVDSVETMLDGTTRAYTQAVADAQAHSLQGRFEEALHVARTLGDSLSVISRTEPSALPVEGRRQLVNKILRQALESNPGFNGTYSAWEPNAVDGRDEDYRGLKMLGADATGRVLPYWTRNPETGAIKIQPLVEYDSRELHANGVMKGGWYVVPAETGKESVLGPLPYVVQGREVFLATMSVPIRVGNTFVGVAGADFDLAFVQKLAAAVAAKIYGGRSHIVILSDLGLVVADSAKPELVGKSFADQTASWDADLKAVQSGAATTAWSADGDTLRTFSPIALGNSERPWSVLVTVPRAIAMAEAEALGASLSERSAAAVGWQTAVGLGAALLAMIAIWFAAGGVSRPIVAMTGAMRSLADGNLDTEVPARGQSDEIGQMAEAVQVFKDNAQEVQRLQAEQEAQKDRAAAERREAMHALATEFEASVMEIVEEVSRQSGELSQSAELLTARSYRAPVTPGPRAPCGAQGLSGRPWIHFQQASTSPSRSSALPELSTT